MIVVGVPFSCQELMNTDEISGGTPYGASTIAGGDGSRSPSENELTIARFQGKHVAAIAAKLACNRKRAGENALGFLIEGVWHDGWYDTKKTGGRFVRQDSAFRNFVTPDGGPDRRDKAASRPKPGAITSMSRWPARGPIGR